MSKKITIELTDAEYEALTKFWQDAKASPLMPSKSLNIDDFVKEIIIGFTKGPDLSSFPDLGNVNMEDLMSQLGNIDSLKDAFESLSKKKPQPKQETKKDEVPDDQKYKS